MFQDDEIDPQLETIASLRQQLDAAEANCQCELIKLEQQLAESQAKAEHWEATCHGQWESYQQLFAESQAREKVLRDALTRASGFEVYMEDKVITEALALPSDSTALDSAIRQAKREALLEAINEWEKPYGLTDGSLFIERLRRMAEEVGTSPTEGMK